MTTLSGLPVISAGKFWAETSINYSVIVLAYNVVQFGLMTLLNDL
jgi:hypothetical protein